MIEIKNLKVAYKYESKNLKAVRGINLELLHGKSYGIIGESGSGKTTLAMALLKLLPENTDITGEIIYDGKDLLRFNNKEFNRIRWKELSVVFQGSMNSFSPVHRIRTQFQDVYKVHYPQESNDNIKRKVLELFDKFNLPNYVYDVYPHELSGGMMQRVTIVLALILKPGVIILDEATTALDVINEVQILESIKEVETEMEITRINITHDLSIVFSSCTEIIVMYGGHIVEKGHTKDVLTSPKHPYTKGLLDAYPDISDFNSDLKGIPGALPDLTKDYHGCIYYERCKNRIDICKTEAPRIITSGEREYACHNPLGIKDE